MNGQADSYSGVRNHLGHATYASGRRSIIIAACRRRTQKAACVSVYCVYLIMYLCTVFVNLYKNSAFEQNKIQENNDNSAVRCEHSA